MAKVIDRLLSEECLRMYIFLKSIVYKPLPAQCSEPEAYLPTAHSPRKVPPRTDRKYPTFIVMTANMLGSNGELDPHIIKESNTYSK
jgi:hypothetical protein